MPSQHKYNYSSSSGSSRSSSSSSAADLARELGGLSINQKKGRSPLPSPMVCLNAKIDTITAPTYNSSSSSRVEARYSEPKRVSQPSSRGYDTTTITPDTSRSRTSYSYGEPVVHKARGACADQRRLKTTDSRYCPDSFLDSEHTYKSSKREPREDARYYPNSSYYRQGR